MIYFISGHRDLSYEDFKNITFQKLEKYWKMILGQNL